MNTFAIAAALLVGLSGSLVHAAEVVGQQRTITRTYVSPSASGSISESSRQEGYNGSGYGGYQVPDAGYNNGSSYQGNSSTQTRGNIQQSIEYPGVGEFQRQPGSTSVEQNRR